jgi:hypothetical protein
MKAPLTAERAREMLHYEPTTGVFTWRRSLRGGGASVGKVAGTLRSDGYRQLQVDARVYAAHRVAWLYVHGTWPTATIDHINGDPADNRISNLRDVPNAINCQNIRAPRSHSKSQVMGVRRTVRNKINPWYASIVVDGRYVFLGCFQDAAVAGQAYLTAKRALHEGNTL